MKHSTIYTLLAILVILMGHPVSASVPTDSSKVKVSFAYDLDFDMQFDNREFSKSAFTSSMTIFGARLTPAVGVALQQQNGTRHRLMAGIDIMKDFGSAQSDIKKQNIKLFREITLYYVVEKSLGKTDFSLSAGIFPRTFMEGSYSPAFFSDSLRFYDNNIEGLLMKFKRPKASFEVGCDWMGMKDTNSRERFMLFTAGEGRVWDYLSLGYAAYLYHFASSEVSKGVVDNALVNPYLRFDLDRIAPLEVLSFRLGWLQSLQNDRVHVGHYVFPCGGEFVAHIQKWNVGIKNDLFVGVDMMPYYNSKDNAGYKYGNLLYMGSPFYRVHDDGTKGVGLSDRLEVYYAPKFGAPYLDLKVSALFYFNTKGYCGTRQMVSLNFNLHQLLNRKKQK